MELFSALRLAVVVAASFAFVTLLALMVGARSLGRKPIYARPSGSGAQGVSYAFFRGMLPWAKESVAKHVPTFVAGLFYHAGIFAALFALLLTLARVTPNNQISQILRTLTAIGFLSGVGLLVKRVALPKMRLISTIDDGLSNLLVDVFIGTALASSYLPQFESVFLVAAAILFVYVPLGKIRHCVFFFWTRVIFGLFYGRRGVLPPSYGDRGVR